MQPSKKERVFKAPVLKKKWRRKPPRLRQVQSERILGKPIVESNLIKKGDITVRLTAREGLAVEAAINHVKLLFESLTTNDSTIFIRNLRAGLVKSNLLILGDALKAKIGFFEFNVTENSIDDCLTVLAVCKERNLLISNHLDSAIEKLRLYSKEIQRQKAKKEAGG